MSEFTTFPRFEISGDAKQRGIIHGEALREQIGISLKFYKQLFNLPDKIILQRAAFFRSVITKFSTDYTHEIEGIAEGANIDPLWIYALNARTEIIATGGGLFSNECTTMCFTKSSILGQTWDWGKALENLCAIVRITNPDGHIIQMLTEPGILGKIGMNNSGLGVCLNILTIDKPLNGLPIHVMLRALLDCKTIEQAKALIQSHGAGKSSNIIVADANGKSFDTEFAADEIFSPAPLNENHIHTNHYLAKPINNLDDPAFEDSKNRLAKACQLVGGTSIPNVDAMKVILSDQSNPDHPIFRTYVAHDHLKQVGTLATFIMDLPLGKMHIRRGNAQNSQFEEITV